MMGMVSLCREMGWSYREYMETPIDVIAGVGAILEAESRIMAPTKNVRRK